MDTQFLKPNTDSEKLVQAVVRYLSECVSLPKYQEHIKGNLTSIFQVILIPNISITQEDTDWYEDEPETYVKNDLEETDVETRRSICKKFLQRLTK